VLLKHKGARGHTVNHKNSDKQGRGHISRDAEGYIALIDSFKRTPVPSSNNIK